RVERLYARVEVLKHPTDTLHLRLPNLPWLDDRATPSSVESVGVGHVGIVKLGEDGGQVSPKRVPGHIEHGAGGEFRGIRLERLIILFHTQQLRKGKSVARTLAIGT